MAENAKEVKKIRQKRSSNFTESEKNCFLGIMEKYKHIIECKRTDAISSKSKQKTWDRISLEFNAQSISPEHRPAENLKLLWDNLKRNTRKHLSSLRQETYRTANSTYSLSYQNRGENKTPEKSAALIQAKLEYLEILKKEALEKAAMEKEILQNTLIEQELKIKLLRRQLEVPTFVKIEK